MNNLDWIILFIVAVSALISINRGFIREVLSIVGWVVGAILVVTFLPIALPFLNEHTNSESTAKIVGSVAIFGAFMVFWMIFSAGIASKIKASKLGNVDKGLGLFFGLARAFLLIVLLNILAGFIYPDKSDQPEVFEKSKYFQIAGSFAEPIEKLIPKSIFEKLEKQAKDTTQDAQDKKSDAKKSAKDVKKEVTQVKNSLEEKVKQVEEAPQNIEDLIGELGLE